MLLFMQEPERLMSSSSSYTSAVISSRSGEPVCRNCRERRGVTQGSLSQLPKSPG